MRQPEPKTVLVMNASQHLDVLEFALALRPLFPDIHDAIAAMLRTTPQYAKWLQSVARCSDCNRYVPVQVKGRCRTPHFILHHRKCEGYEGSYAEECPGSLKTSKQATNQHKALTAGAHAKLAATVDKLIPHVATKPPTLTNTRGEF